MPAHRKDFGHAVALYGEGHSVAAVAEHFGVSRQAMFKALKRRSVEMRPRVRSGEDNHFFAHGEGYGADKHAAKTEVMKAVRSGRLVRQACEKCGEPPTTKDGRNVVQAHHDDYSKPLQVRWLCTACHYEEHHP